jgi:hypothetical protein
MPTVQSQESLTEQPVDIMFPAGNRYSEEPPLETDLHLRQIRPLAKVKIKSI